MLSLTKIFHFEMAHAIHGYAGACKNIHGHSYELHITVSAITADTTYIPAPGFIIDFKEIKKIVTEKIITAFDHHIILSKDFLAANNSLCKLKNLIILDAEPSAENILIHFKNVLKGNLPTNIRILRLKLFETNNSFAVWEENIFPSYINQ